MFKKILLAINLRFLCSLFGKKNTRTIALVVLDGPSSVSVSKKLSSMTEEIVFYVPVQYSSPVLKSELPFSLIVASSFYQYITVFLSVIWQTEGEKISSILTMIDKNLIRLYLEKNNKLISNVVVFNERGPFACSALAAAKRFNIRTCCIQHGAIVENYFPIHVDVYFTWSKYFSDVVKSGCSRVLTINVGRLDYTVPQANFVEKSNKPLVALQPGNTSIPFPVLLDNFVDVVEVCLEVFNGVVLRRHPNDNISADLLARLGCDKRIFFDDDLLNDSLAKRNVVISLYSTVLLEASMSGCLTVQYVSDSWFKPIYQRSINIFYTKQSLREFIEKVKYSPNFTKTNFSDGIVCQPDYKLFFGTLELV